MADTTITIQSVQFRCTFTAGYRPTQLAEAEPFIQYADRVLIFGGRGGQGRVEVPFDRDTGGGGSGPASTDALPEGTANLYFTQARARASFSVGGALTYNQATGQISYTPPSLAAVATSGAYSDLSGAPALAAVATSGSASDLASGTLPVARLPSSGVIAGSYGTGAQIPVITTDGYGRITSITTTANTGGGGGSGPSSTDALPEGTTNLYFTQSRARAAISATGALAYNASTGVISYTAPALAAVATSGAYSDLSGRPTLATVATSGSASDLGTGTLPAARLPSSGVTAGSYGSGSQIPVITTDGYGRITSITTAANAGGGASGTVTPSGTFAVGDIVGANTTDGNSIESLGQPGPLVRGLLSGIAGIAFNSSTGVFSLATPTASVLGGVLAASAGSNQFQTGVSSSGAPTFAQPAFSNLSGSATAAQMPAFTGDVTSSAGATVLTLATSGVTAGTYTAATVTVDTKGRVTAASSGDLSPFAPKASPRFTGSSGVSDANGPYRFIQNTSAPTNSKYYDDCVYGDGSYHFRILDDNYANARDVFSVTRTGTTPGTISFSPSILGDISGSTVFVPGFPIAPTLTTTVGLTVYAEFFRLPADGSDWGLALQRAQRYLASSGGTIRVATPGELTIATQVSFPKGNPYIKLVCESQATVFKNASTLTSAMFSLGGTSAAGGLPMDIENCSFVGYSTSNSYAFYLNNANTVTFRHCRFTSMATAINCASSFAVTLEDVVFDTVTAPFYSSTAAHNLVIRRVKAYSGGTVVRLDAATDNVSIVESDFEYTGAALQIAGGTALRFCGNYVEYFTGDPIYPTAPLYGSDVSNNWIALGSGGSATWAVKNFVGGQLKGNSVYNQTIAIGAGTSDLEIGDNQVTGSGSVVSTPYAAPSFTNGWYQQSGYSAVGYRLSRSGQVILRGNMLNAGSNLNTAAFTLPAKYRPSTYRNFATANSSNNASFVQVTPDGKVTVVSTQAGAGTSGNPYQASLDGIAFEPGS